MSNQAGLGIGDAVHNQEINEYPEDMRSEYLRLSEWVREMYATYGRRVWVKVIDPQSLVGMIKYLRHGVRTYPTFVLDGEHVFAGWDAAQDVASQVEALLQRQEPAAAGQMPG